MNIAESIKSSLKNVLANKLRTLLTMLGIIIGISAVIIITSLGEGARQTINTQFENLGMGRLTVMMSRSRGVVVKESDLLTMNDKATLEKSNYVKSVASFYSNSNAQIRLLNPTETNNATLSGTSPEDLDISKYTILEGRFFNANDIAFSSNVAVIYDTTAEKVFGSQNALGQAINVKTQNGTKKFSVIGIIENPSAQIMYNSDSPETILLPVSTVQKMFNVKYVSTFSVVLKDPNEADIASQDLTTRLEQKHNSKGKYYVQNIMSRMDSVNTMLSTVTTVISLIAAISLVVGGIGVMNIMLVTVTERTREIGIRKSIGARNEDIRWQFIVEALILTSIGGIIGILLGWGGGVFIAYLAGIEAVISFGAVFTAVMISTTIGLVFGVYPANKAAILDPIEALRYE